MKKTLRLIALMMVAALVICAFASCGKTTTSDNKADGEAASEEVKGSVEEHGYYKVFVPEGYTLKHEDAFGDNNPKSFNINNDEKSLTYFMFNMFDEDNAKTSIDTTKEMNDGAEDISVEYNGVTWTGVAYDSVGIACFSVYADFGDDNFVILSAAGNAYDSAITSAILSSLEVNVTD